MEPIKLFNCLKVFGDDNFSMASVFLIGGFVPSTCSLTTQLVCMQTYIYPMISPGFPSPVFSELAAIFVCVHPTILL